MITQHNPLHPGEFIKQIYLEPLRVGNNQLAKELKVTPATVSRLINGHCDVSATMALKLSVVLGRTAESWLQMQSDYTLWKERQNFNTSEYQSIAA